MFWCLKKENTIDCVIRLIKSKKYIEAVALLKEKQYTDPALTSLLAFMYAFDLGVPYSAGNERTAFDLFDTAATCGDLLGRVYVCNNLKWPSTCQWGPTLIDCASLSERPANSYKYAHDPFKSMRLLLNLADKINLAPAQYFVARMTLSNQVVNLMSASQAWRMMLRAGEAGFGSAERDIAEVYRYGTSYCAKDRVAAEKWEKRRT